MSRATDWLISVLWIVCTGWMGAAIFGVYDSYVELVATNVRTPEQTLLFGVFNVLAASIPTGFLFGHVMRQHQVAKV